jgi:hypothetical protein
MASNRRTATETIDVREGVNTVELVLESGVEVSGRVVDRGGGPVAAADVRLQNGSMFRVGGPAMAISFSTATALTDGAGAEGRVIGEES